MSGEQAAITPEAQATSDFQSIAGAEGSGNQVDSIARELNEARSQFQNPADYNKYLNSLQDQFADKDNEALVQTIQIVDSATEPNGPNGMMTSLAREESPLFDVLDSYHNAYHGGSGSADGNVGDKDVQDFLSDLDDPESHASIAIKQIAAEQGKDPAELKGEVQDFLSRGDFKDGFTKDSLAEKFGYEGDNAAEQFAEDHPALPEKPVVISDASGRPVTVVEANGTSTSVHYDDNGNIDGVNRTEYKDLPRAGVQALHTSSKLDANGNWTNGFDANQPAELVAPFVQDGNFGFYVPGEGDIYQKVTVNSDTGAVTQEQVDASNPDVAIQGVNRPMAVDPNNENQFRVGDLDVSAAEVGDGQQISDQALKGSQGQAAYTISEGDNLTDIARSALGVDKNYDGPEVQQAIEQLATANGYANPDQIPAGATLIIPPDFRV